MLGIVKDSALYMLVCPFKQAPSLTGPGSLMVVGSMALRLLEPNFSRPRREYCGVVLIVESATFPKRSVLM